MWRCSAAVAFAALVLASSGGAETHPPPLAKLVGQTLLTGFSGRHPSSDFLRRVRAGEVGGVVLFGRNIGSPAELRALLRELQAAAAAGGNPPLLVALDQEGGPVRRLRAGPPSMSAAELGRRASVALAESEGAATGRYLRAAGIAVDLAPVLDSPRRRNFLGSRVFSADPQLNARLGVAFVAGLQRERVAATAKHFPGLGAAHANTDVRQVLVTSTAAELDDALSPFAAAVDDGVKLVMMSNAEYLHLAGRVPAVLSRRIVTGVLRDRLGFEGVVVSDQMESPGPRSRPGASVRALQAGVDLLLYTSERGSRPAYDDLLRAASAGTLSRATLEAANVRIALLKRWLRRA